MSIACVIFTCRKNHDVLKMCMPAMTPIMEMFDAIVATDRMPANQREDLAAIPDARFKVEEAGEDADWITVARHVTGVLGQQGYSSFLCVLDDFYFFDIRAADLRSLVIDADRQRIPGIRLVREKPRIQLLFKRSRQSPQGLMELNVVPEDNPYKHSLSLSFWNTEYFAGLLKGDITIWDFERLPHDLLNPTLYAPRPLCSYNHVVEKGQLAKFAQRLPGAPTNRDGVRPTDSHWTYAMRWFRANILFFFLGYTFANRRFRREDARRNAGAPHPGQVG